MKKPELELWTYRPALPQAESWPVFLKDLRKDLRNNALYPIQIPLCLEQRNLYRNKIPYIPYIPIPLL
jgi:hypothetical protein